MGLFADIACLEGGQVFGEWVIHSAHGGRSHSLRLSPDFENDVLISMMSWGLLVALSSLAMQRGALVGSFALPFRKYH